MALKSISLNGNFDWCPLEEYKNNLICFNSYNALYSNTNNFVYLLDINLNSEHRNLDIINKLNFEEILKNEPIANHNGNANSVSSNGGNEFVTTFEWLNSSVFVDAESEEELNKGILVGGLTNGDIVLINPQCLFSPHMNFSTNTNNNNTNTNNNNNNDYENFLINRVNVHEKAVNCLEYNRHKNHLIATGGDDGQLFVTDIENVYSPTSYDPFLNKNSLQKITCLNWNRQVSHILATSSNTGTTFIWDLKMKKAAASFSDPHNRTKTSSLCWLANQPTQIAISYDDDRSPCLQLWDLRNSTFPIKEIIGHSKGINNICFSNIDSNLLLSSGRDLIKCWYLDNNSFDMFNEISNSSNINYSKWSPFLPDIFASTTFMDMIQINSINNGNKMTTKYIPSFYKKNTGVSFGFGGKICFFNNQEGGSGSIVGLNRPAASNAAGSNSASADLHNTSEKHMMNEEEFSKARISNKRYVMHCHVFPSEMELIKEADIFEQYITSGNYAEFCENKIKNSEEEHEKLTWKILQLLCTSKRAEIVKELGYDINTIHQKIFSSTGKHPGFIFKEFGGDETHNDELQEHSVNELATASNRPTDFNDDGYGADRMMNSLEVDPEKFFRELGEKTENEQTKDNLSAKNSIASFEKMESSECLKKLPSNQWSSGIEAIIKECVLIGNVEAAVELCIHKDRMADALLLSSFGGEQLWNKTKNIYINKKNDSFLKNVNYILDNKLDMLVKNVDLNYWVEALSILCTYALNNSNFNSLCEALAKRLQHEKFDIRAASICYLCACNFPETIEIWNSMPSKKVSLLSVLQDFVEKMTVLKAVIKFDQPNSLMNQKINQYAELLANSGRLKPAMTFLCLIQGDLSLESLILRDRIFNSASHTFQQSQLAPPAIPFQVVDVKPSPSVIQMANQMTAQAHYGHPNPYPQHGQYNQPMSYGQSQPMQFNQSKQVQANQYAQMPLSAGAGVSNSIKPIPNQQPPSGSHLKQVSGLPSALSYTNINTSPKTFQQTNYRAPAPNAPPTYNTPPHFTQPVANQYQQSYQQHATSPISVPAPGAVSPAPAPMPVQPPFQKTQFNPSQTNIAPPPAPNATAPISTMHNQFMKREPYDHTTMSTSSKVTPPLMNNVVSPPKNFTNSFAGSNAGSTTGVSASSPIAAALTVSPGMPVPWPIPTTTQQLGSTTQSTAQENRKIQTAAKVQTGVRMSPNNIDMIKQAVTNLLNMYVSQEPIKKKVEDVSMKINDFFEKLDSGAFSQQINEHIINICNYITANDFRTTNKLIVDLSRNLWDNTNKSWIMALKRIIPKC